jgi:hypothetical protein
MTCCGDLRLSRRDPSGSTAASADYRHVISVALKGFADSKLRPVSLKGLSVRLLFKQLKSSFIEKIPTELQYLGDSPPYSTPEILCTVVSGIFICFCEGIVS